MIDSGNPQYWEEHYQSENLPWDFHGIPEEVTHFLKTTPLQGRGKVLIPGCGPAYEIEAFLTAGWDPWGIDFSKCALQQARGVLEKHSNRILFGDFFTHPFNDPFNVIYERNFLYALPPRLKTSYAQRISELLVPEGELIGFFCYKNETEDPYSLDNLEKAKNLLCDFQLIKDLSVKNSLPAQQGKERWQEWKKIK